MTIKADIIAAIKVCAEATSDPAVIHAIGDSTEGKIKLRGESVDRGIAFDIPGVTDCLIEGMSNVIGNVVGPDAATNNAIARYDTTTGKLIQNSAAEVSDLGELKIKLFAQDAEPTLGADAFAAFWKDTNDADKIYLVFRRGTGDQVKIQLT